MRFSLVCATVMSSISFTDHRAPKVKDLFSPWMIKIVMACLGTTDYTNETGHIKRFIELFEALKQDKFIKICLKNNVNISKQIFK